MQPRRLCAATALTLALVAGCSAPLTWPGVAPREDPEPSGPAYLRAYKEAFYRDLGDGFVDYLDVDGFLDATRDARVLYLGDHHTDRRLHRHMLELIEALAARGRRLTLGLEAIGIEDDLDLRAFLAGRIDMSELRRRVAGRWPDSWLDSDEVDSEFYRGLLAFARRRQLSVFAIEPAPRLPLAARDVLIAHTVRGAAQREPDRLIVVVVGHAHLLGAGRLMERVGLPGVATGARLSVTLRRRLDELEPPDDAAFLVASSGLVFFRPHVIAPAP